MKGVDGNKEYYLLVIKCEEWFNSKKEIYTENSAVICWLTVWSVYMMHGRQPVMLSGWITLSSIVKYNWNLDSASHCSLRLTREMEHYSRFGEFWKVSLEHNRMQIDENTGNLWIKRQLLNSTTVFITVGVISTVRRTSMQSRQVGEF